MQWNGLQLQSFSNKPERMDTTLLLKKLSLGGRILGDFTFHFFVCSNHSVINIHHLCNINNNNNSKCLRRILLSLYGVHNILSNNNDDNNNKNYKTVPKV